MADTKKPDPPPVKPDTCPHCGQKITIPSVIWGS